VDDRIQLLDLSNVRHALETKQILCFSKKTVSSNLGLLLIELRFDKTGVWTG
jgi:hypothetical protein